MLEKGSFTNLVNFSHNSQMSLLSKMFSMWLPQVLVLGEGKGKYFALKKGFANGQISLDVTEWSDWKGNILFFFSVHGSAFFTNMNFAISTYKRDVISFSPQKSFILQGHFYLANFVRTWKNSFYNIKQNGVSFLECTAIFHILSLLKVF